MTPPAHVLVAGPPDHCLELHFQRQADRFAHCLLHRSGPDRQDLLQSVEGGPSDRWPVSAPLQQYHQQPLPDGRHAIFAVGQAGRGHWSLVAACEPDRPTICYEVACRFQPSPDEQLASAESSIPQDAITQLGMTYAASDAWQLTTPRTATLKTQDWRCQLELEPGDALSQLRRTEEGLRMDVKFAAVKPGAITRIWKYEVRLEPQ